MKKLLLTGLLLGVAGAHAADPNFDFQNKTNKPLFAKVGTDATSASQGELIELGVSSEEAKTIKGRLTSAAKFFGKKATGAKPTAGEPYYQTTVDNSGQTVILLSESDSFNAGDKVTSITIKRPNKTIYIRIKPDNSGKILFTGDSQKYLVGPQTGPLGGILGKSERGLKLDNNVSQNDITVNPDFVIP